MVVNITFKQAWDVADGALSISIVLSYQKQVSKTSRCQFEPESTYLDKTTKNYRTQCGLRLKDDGTQGTFLVE